jgi:hypothetical protein
VFSYGLTTSGIPDSWAASEATPGAAILILAFNWYQVWA